MPHCHFSLPPLPCHLQCPTFKCSKGDALSTCIFGTSQSPKWAGPQWSTKGREAWETGGDAPETLAPHNMVPQSVPIIFL